MVFDIQPPMLEEDLGNPSRIVPISFIQGGGAVMQATGVLYEQAIVYYSARDLTGCGKFPHELDPRP